MASTSLYRTESAGSRTTFTWSAWVKRSKSGSSQFLASCSYSASDEAYFFFNGGDKLIWQSSSASYGDVQTNRLFRDTNAWYHIVLAVDTTQGTAANRIKFYVNGVQETSFSTANYPNQNTQVYWNVGGSYYPRIGKRHANADNFDGSMSHVVHIDGTQELPTIFGETDSTTGEWKIKTSITPSVGWGTNGYHILKDGNSLTDQSGQGNNWTAIGTLTKTEDCPSNVFATLNPLNVPTSNAPTFSNGNTQSVSSSSASGAFGGSSTIGVSSGKWYMEAKCLTSGHTQSAVGVTYNDAETARTNNGGTDSYEYSYRMNGNKGHDNTDSSYGNTYTTNDIIGVALDLDNNKIYFSKNGTFQNSGVPTSGSTGTGAAFTVDSGQTYMFYHHDTTGASSNTSTFAFNFGNGYFGTTAVSSAGTNASGNGIFEYDVPTGYTALSTKGLNL